MAVTPIGAVQSQESITIFTYNVVTAFTYNVVTAILQNL
jgi:hypothetical protein